MTNATKQNDAVESTPSPEKLAEYQEMIDILKFTPRTYKIQVYGYGGDSRFLAATKEQYLYFREHEIDIEDYTGSWDNEHDVPEQFQPFPPGEPYDGDELYSACGANFDDGGIVEITDEHGNTVFKADLSSVDDDCEVDECDEWYAHHGRNDGDIVIWHGNGEKGTFYGGEIELKSPFDPSKLKFEYVDCDGTTYLSDISYDGEGIDNNDYSTTGKWAETKWIVIGGEDKIDLTGIDVSVKLRAELSKKTEWFPVKTKPVHLGLYECKFKVDKKAAWPWSSNELVEWDGKRWLHDTKKVEEWRGLTEKIVE
jgi:hypothetical protein